MPSMDELAEQGISVYSVVVAASKRARIVNDWRLQRSRILYEETTGPKATSQALEEIADGTVKVITPSKK